jgi:hypothetical protein
VIAEPQRPGDIDALMAAFNARFRSSPACGPFPRAARSSRATTAARAASTSISPGRTSRSCMQRPTPPTARRRRSSIGHRSTRSRHRCRWTSRCCRSGPTGTAGGAGIHGAGIRLRGRRAQRRRVRRRVHPRRRQDRHLSGLQRRRAPPRSSTRCAGCRCDAGRCRAAAGVRGGAARCRGHGRDPSRRWPAHRHAEHRAAASVALETAVQRVEQQLLPALRRRWARPAGDVASRSPAPPTSSMRRASRCREFRDRDAAELPAAGGDLHALGLAADDPGVRAARARRRHLRPGAAECARPAIAARHDHDARLPDPARHRGEQSDPRGRPYPRAAATPG